VAAEEAYPVDCSERERNEFRKMDLHFHELLFRGAGIPALTELHARIRAQLQLLYRGKAKTTTTQVAREHRMILNALEERLVPVAEELVRHHIRGAMGRCLCKDSVLKAGGAKERRTTERRPTRARRKS